MQWEGREESGNVEDRRGKGPSQGLMIGGGAAGVVVLLIGLIFGVDVQKFLGGGGEPQGGGPVDPSEEPLRKFSSIVFRDTETVWGEQFKKMGKRYENPKLVIYDDSTPTKGCGEGKAAIGPFYCPADSTVYIDLNFYEVLEKQLGAAGQFARAYVLAHEVGHHVQRLLGYSTRVDEARRTGPERLANQMSVRLELQADYLAGVFAFHMRDEYKLKQSDIDTATNAAFKIGDDYLQKRGGGRVSPEKFTHGTSAQRKRWFMEGYRMGSVMAAALLFDLPYEGL